MQRGVDTGKSVASDPSVVVMRMPGRKPTCRKVFKVLSGGTHFDYRIDNDTVDNLERGVLERVRFVKDAEGNFCKPTPPLPGVYGERLVEFKRKLVSRLPYAAPVSVGDFPQLYRGRKRTIYQNAVDSLCWKPVNRRDSYSRSFGKAEKKNETLKPLAPTRLIHPRHPRYNVMVGRFLKPFEKACYVGIARVWGDTTVSKGLNAQQTGNLIFKKWNSFRSPVAVGLDASRFDQHVSVQALEWEHGIYNIAFKDPELAELLKWQLETKCFGVARDGLVKYTVKGMRMSGDINTALGNCLLMCALVWSYCKSIGVRAKLINNGDDCVVFMEERDLDSFNTGVDEWFKQMGFTMKVEVPCHEIEHIEFCQTRPVWTPTDGYICVRNLRPSLAKDCCSVIDISSKGGFEKWIYAVGECGLALAGGIPVFDSFYRLFVRSGVKGGSITSHSWWESGMVFLSRGMDRSGLAVDPKTRHSFYLAFGVTPCEQVAAERHYDSLSLTHSKPTPIEEPEWLFANSLPEAVLYPHSEQWPKPK